MILPGPQPPVFTSGSQIQGRWVLTRGARHCPAIPCFQSAEEDRPASVVFLSISRSRGPHAGTVLPLMLHGWMDCLSRPATRSAPNFWLLADFLRLEPFENELLLNYTGVYGPAISRINTAMGGCWSSSARMASVRRVTRAMSARFWRSLVYDSDHTVVPGVCLHHQPRFR